MARTKKEKIKEQPAKKTRAKIKTKEKNKEPTRAEIKNILRLPEGPEGDERLDKMLASFGEEFTAKERLFILFYASPTSIVCGKISKAGEMVRGMVMDLGPFSSRMLEKELMIFLILIHYRPLKIFSVKILNFAVMF